MRLARCFNSLYLSVECVKEELACQEWGPCQAQGLLAPVRHVQLKESPR